MTAKWECSCVCHPKNGGAIILHDHACCEYCYTCEKLISCSCVRCNRNRDFNPGEEHAKECKKPLTKRPDLVYPEGYDAQDGWSWDD